MARVGLLACLALVAGACGSDDEGGGDEAAPTTAAAAPSDETTETTAASAPEEGPGTPAAQPLAERTSVTIGVPVAIEPFAALYLAIANGEFEAENLDVTVATLQLPDGLVQLGQGRLQLYLAGPAAGAFNAVAGGGEARFVANTHAQSAESEEGLWVNRSFLDESGELDGDQVPGMRIAVGGGGVGSPPALPINQLLEESGHTINDVESVTLGGADMVTALIQGGIDGGFVLSPFWQDPALDECCVLVTDQPPFAAGIYIMNESFMNDERDVAEAIMRALMRTNRTYLQGDYHADDAVMESLASAFGVTVEALSGTPALTFDPDLGFDSEVVQPIQEMWISVGGILSYEEPIPDADIIDTSVIDDILAGE